MLPCPKVDVRSGVLASTTSDTVFEAMPEEEIPRAFSPTS